ncbi:MAG: HAD family hydrolase, partial [Thermodesulfobacteriota bacterium]
MIDLKTKKAVFFDFGDTLVTTIETYPKRIELAFAENGYLFKENEFIEAYHYSDYEIFSNYKKSGAIRQNEHQNILFDLLIKNLGTKNLDFKDDYSKLKLNIRKSLGKIEYKRKKIPGCDELLSLLKKKGLTLAVISNNDGHTAKKCRGTGIDNYFDVIVDSTKVKMVKPDVKIFNYILDKLKLKREETVHIGDLYGSDILGAMNSGIDPVWINHRNCKNYDNLNITTVKD